MIMTTDTVSSREVILNKVRSGKPHLIPLPEVPIYAYPGNKLEGFETHLSAFDGKFQEFDTRADVMKWLDSELDKKKVIFSALPDYKGTVDNAEFADPHAAHVVDICIGEGVLGVAETGSVWVNNSTLELAAAALFSTDLYLLLEKSKIVDGLHAAYANLDIRQHQYGAFFTGPSATADIEAVHITGAQGEISLTVLLYGNQ